MPLTPDARLLWDEVRNPTCTDCPLHKSAQTVCIMGDGPVPAKIMIVGEAPGFREDEIGRPFSGRSGRLLDDMLQVVSLSRERCYITNTVKCRPPENATPNKTQQKACRHYLDDEIARVQPEFILLLGNTALSVIKKSGIMKHRGVVTELGEAKVLATVHPAAVLRNPRFRGLMESDLRTFARLVRGVDADIPAPRTFLVTNKETLAKCCEAILKSEAVAYDLETNGFDEMATDAAIACIAISPKPGIAFVVPISHPETPWKHPERVLKTIANALAYTPAKRIAHNAKFDDRWLIQHAGPVYADFDTMLAAHILDENRFKSLKVLAPMILGVDQWAIDLGDGAAMTTPLNKLARYNAKDTDYTLRLYYVFREELKAPGNERLLRLFVKIMMPASRVFTDIEHRGMWVDKKRLAERRIEVQKRRELVSKKLTKLFGIEANWNSPKVLAEILFDKLKLPVLDLTAGGAPSTRESVLLRLASKHESANLILEWRQWSKNESTYLGKWAGQLHGDRLHPNYKMSGTVTGRLASGKEEASDIRVGMQQVPRDPFIRSVFGAPPGWKFVEADFSQIELRIAAHYAQDKTMLRLFNQGADIHMEMAQQMLNKPVSAITKEERKKAKSVNFGFLFGMGWGHFVEYARDNYGVIVSEDEAKLFRDRFFGTFKGLRPWHERQKRLVRQYYRVQSLIGRVRRLPDIDSEDKQVRAESERQAINSPVQGLASDMMLFALTLLHAEMSEDEAIIVGSVHDSGMFEVRDDRLDYWVPRIKEVMENLPLKKQFGVELTVPIKVDVKVSQHWSEEDENLDL